MSGADIVLDRLDGVRQVGYGRWRPRCPAHDSRNRSVLSVAQCADGVTLIKCFAGCTAAEVVAAVSLQLRDLFPRVEWQPTGVHHIIPRRPRVDRPALIAAVERDLLPVKITLALIAKGEAGHRRERLPASGDAHLPGDRGGAQ